MFFILPENATIPACQLRSTIVLARASRRASLARRRSSALLADVEEFNTIWALPAWYGYLLLLDAAIYHIQDNSFLSHRRRETLAMLAWSVPFWLMYEGYNFSFGTGITCIARARQARKRRCCSWPTRRYCRRFSFMPNCSRRGGGAGLALPPAYRRAVLLVYRRSRRTVSCCRSSGRGNVSGCSGARGWLPEALNVQARRAVIAGDSAAVRRACSACSWRACWPGLSGRATTTARAANGSIPCLASRNGRFSKCPAPVFLGFPFLALEAFSTYSLICHVARGGRTWERTTRKLPGPSRPGSAGWPCAGHAAHARHRRPHVSDNRPLGALLIELDAVRAGMKRHCARSASRRRSGWSAPPTPKKPPSQRAGVPIEILQAAVWQAKLSEHKGMGADAAWLVMMTGIRDVRTWPRKNRTSCTRDWNCWRTIGACPRRGSVRSTSDPRRPLRRRPAKIDPAADEHR